MNALLRRIPLYISHFLNVVDEHSLHAPFVYELYTKVIKGVSLPDPAIERYRRQFKESKEEIRYHTYGETSTLNHKSRGSIASIARWGINNTKNSCLFARLIQHFDSRNVVELGTSLGVNTACLAKAGEGVQVRTFEGHPTLAKHARELFESLELKNIEVVEGDIDDTLPEFIEKCDPIDFALIDANHKKIAMHQYYALLLPKIQEHSIVVIDDIRWSAEMYSAWNELKGRQEVKLSLDLLDMGLLFFKEGMKKQHYALKK